MGKKDASGRIDQILEELRSEYPVFQDFLPLGSGIEQSLTAKFPNDPSWRIISALRKHVNDPRYLQMVQRSQQRYNMNGQPVGEVSEAERLHARSTLEMLKTPRSKTVKDPLGEATEGFRLLLSKQAAYKFGPQVASDSRAHLDRIRNEGTMEEVGKRLMDVSTPEEWLELLEAMSAGS